MEPIVNCVGPLSPICTYNSTSRNSSNLNTVERLLYQGREQPNTDLGKSRSYKAFVFVLSTRLYFDNVNKGARAKSKVARTEENRS